MRLCSIASGSSGNCIYAGSDETHLLIDTGISKKRIEEGLHEIGIMPLTYYKVRHGSYRVCHIGKELPY